MLKKYSILTLYLYLIFILNIKIFAKINLLIPLYSCPSDQNGEIWRKVLKIPKTITTVVIWGIICDNDNYTFAIKKLKKNGILNIAYISTDSGKKSIKVIKEKIDFYCKFPIDGYFFDEVSSNINLLSFYKKILNYAKKKGNFQLTVINSPYANVEFLKKLDPKISIIYENSFNELKNFNINKYKSFPSEKIAILLHHTTEKFLKYSIKFAKKNKIGWIYITNRDWDKLPTYFNLEVQYINLYNKLMYGERK